MMDVRDQLNDRGARGPRAGTSASSPASPPAAPNGSSPAALDPDQFRSILGRFASGVTVSAFCSVSLAPPLVLVCIDRDASMHELLHETTHFAVNILSSRQEAL